MLVEEVVVVVVVVVAAAVTPTGKAEGNKENHW